MRRIVALSLLFSSPVAWSLTDLVGSYGGCEPTSIQNTVNADSGNYETAVSAAVAGDRIVLASGTYTNGLRLYDLNGSPNNCIVIEGPSDRSAVFVGQPINGIRNVVQIRNSSYLVLRNLEIDGTGTTDLDGVKSDTNIQGAHPNPWSHHITLENLHVHDFDFDQQQVGISTKGPAWNWVVRENLIERVGTGIYFGNSDGAQHFVNGLIEFNLIRDTVGYNMQIKHQFAASRPAGIGYETLPATGQTVIRHNVFHKSGNSSTGGAERPNLLTGSQPLSGNGADDDVIIYGNFLFQNPSGAEALFQGEGNLILFGNVFYNDQGPGIAIREQNGEVRRVRVFQNTVLADGTGISIGSSVNMSFQQLVWGNAVFASGTPILRGDQADNITDTLISADSYLLNPSGIVTGMSNRMDLFPEANQLTGTTIDTGPISSFVDFNRDFNDDPRDGTFRGAYAGESSNPGWQLGLEFKPQGPPDTLFANGFE